MKKVLFISSLYHPHVGGVETMITELSEFYGKQNIESVSLTKKWPSELAEYEEYNGTQIYRITNARSEEDFIKVVNWLNINDFKIKSDIIHVIGVRRPLPLVGLLLSRKWQVPIICTIAGGDVPDDFDSGPTKVWEEGKEFIPDVLRQSDNVNCVSSALIKDLNKALPDLKNVDTLYAGIEMSIINSATVEKIKDKYIFCFRRLDPSKGVDILIKAFNLIKDIFPDLYLIIAGEGSEEINLKSLVDKYALGDRVIFTGTVELKRGLSLLKGATLTVVPSLSEGGGLVNVEAQACRCPVIASRVGGIPEYIEENESGLLFEPGNFEELANKMEHLLKNEDLRKKLIYGGIKHAEKFDWEVLAPKYLELYERLIINHDKNIEFKPWSELTAKLWNIIKE